MLLSAGPCARRTTPRPPRFATDQAIVNTRTGTVTGAGALASQTAVGRRCKSKQLRCLRQGRPGDFQGRRSRPAESALSATLRRGRRRRGRWTVGRIAHESTDAAVAARPGRASPAVCGGRAGAGRHPLQGADRHHRRPGRGGQSQVPGHLARRGRGAAGRDPPARRHHQRLLDAPRARDANGQPACGGTERIVADGHVYYVTPDAERPRRPCRLYRRRTTRSCITGDVIVVQGKDVARGDRLTHQGLDQQRRSTMESNATGRRPSPAACAAVFYPDKTRRGPARPTSPGPA